MKSLPLAASLSVGGEECGGRYWYWCSAATKVLLDRWSQSNCVATHPTNYNKLQQGNIIKVRVCGEPMTYPWHVLLCSILHSKLGLMLTFIKG